MRWRAIALVSIGVNIALGAAWLLLKRQDAAQIAAAAAALAHPTAGQNTTNYVPRRLPFSWQQIESADFPTYVSNLRLVGCPEQTIRDIIIADVNEVFARRRATEMVTSDQQWWRSAPDTNIVQAAAEKARELEDERRALLNRLLGMNWESGDLVSLPRPSRPGVVLDGPVLGTLSPEAKQAIQDVSLRSQQRMETYLDTQRSAGKGLDPTDLARLRQQTRDELARLLSPPELEEFLLRYSQNANDLRTEFGQLRFFEATPDEFRAVFRASDALDQRIQLLADAKDQPSLEARKALESQRDNAIKIALGAKRYEEYRMLHDPLYRDAVAAAQDAGTPEAAKEMYAINLAAQAEQSRIRGSTNLSNEQRNIELKRLELEQLQANAVAAGQELPPEPASTPTPPPPKKVYVLGPGDSATTIALMYGLPVAAIKAANPKVDFNRLKPGVAVTIPPGPWTPAGAP